MYTLLPTMKGADRTMISSAIDEMLEYYQENDVRLSHELRWLGILLRRADIVPVEEKAMIEQRLSAYDDLFERDPKMRKFGERYEEKGVIKTLRRNVIAFVRW